MTQFNLQTLKQQNLLKASNLEKILRDSPLLVFTILFFIGLILFGNTLSKPFLCDDYSVLTRIIYDKTIFIKGFFRPLSDFTLYGCYLIGGLNPVIFNFFNLVIHILCSLLLYFICLRLDFYDKSLICLSSISAALLFLAYPYHNEAVVWVVGRASSMACLLGFWSVLLSFRQVRSPLDYVWPCMLYFIGLCSYETIFPLPAIILILLYKPRNSVRVYLGWVIGFGLTLILNLFIRYIVSGGISEGYGTRLFKHTFFEYVSNFAKVLGRSFLPPSDNSLLLIITFSIIVLLSIFILVLLLNRKSNFLLFYKLTAVIAFSFIIPIMFGISTHTFEGDRIIYFSSFFVIIWFSFCLSLVQSPITKVLAYSMIFVYFVIYLEINNRSWIKAGEIVNYLIVQLKGHEREDGRIGLINIPQEYNGALLFRNGLPEAARINNLDPNSFQILRTLTTEEMRHYSGLISLQTHGGQTFIPPGTIIDNKGVIQIMQPISGLRSSYFTKQFSHLYFWNKEKLLLLK